MTHTPHQHDAEPGTRLPSLTLPAAPFSDRIARPTPQSLGSSLAAFSHDVERRSAARADRRSRSRGADRRHYASQVMASPAHGPAHDPRPQLQPDVTPRSAALAPIDPRMPVLPVVEQIESARGLSLDLDDALTVSAASTPAPTPTPLVARLHLSIPPAPAAPQATAGGVPIRRPITPAVPVAGINGERVKLDEPPAPEAAPQPPTSSLSPYPVAVQQALVQPASWMQPATPAPLSAAPAPVAQTAPAARTDDVALVWNSAGDAQPDLSAAFFDTHSTDRMGSAAGVGPRHMNWLMRLVLLVMVPSAVGAGLAFALNEFVVSRL